MQEQTREVKGESGRERQCSSKGEGWEQEWNKFERKGERKEEITMADKISKECNFFFNSSTVVFAKSTSMSPSRIVEFPRFFVIEC